MRLNKASSAIAASGLLALAAGTASATWSIVIVDTRTGEVAAGSATCLTNINLKRETPVIVLGRGAATAQALLEQTGVTRSDLRQGLLLGDHPNAILNTLASNDSGHQSRQYGLVDTQGRAMTFSGAAASDWKGGVIGRIERGAPGPADDIVYAIQGNILTGEGVVLAAETAIRASSGDVADMLMEGMMAARLTGGDGRCSCPTGAPTSCGTPPGAPGTFKSADVGYMIVGRLGDIDASEALYRFIDFSSMQGFDLTGDGRDELLVFEPFSGAVHTYSYLEASVPGALAVEPGPSFTLPINGAKDSQVGDVTGDGIDDLVVASALGGAVWVIPGTTLGLETTSAFNIAGLSGVSSLALIDLDGAGGLDLVAIQSGIEVVPVSGGPGSALTAGTPVPIFGAQGPIRTGDLDNDGDQDLIVRRSITGNAQFLINPGNGGLIAGAQFTPAATVIDAMLLDVDHDGIAEVLTVEAGSRDVAVYTQSGTHLQSLRAGFSPSRFLIGQYDAAVQGEFAVESNRRLTLIAPDGAGGIKQLSFEGASDNLDRPIPLDLNGDGLDEIVAGIDNPTNPTLLLLIENQNGQFNAPRGWGDGRYFLTLNVANTVSADPDPVETLQARFENWRTRNAGHVDAVLSDIQGGAGTLITGTTTTFTATLAAYPGVPITTTPAVTAQTSDNAIARVLSVTTLADGTVEIVVEGVMPGAVSLRVTADDSGARPVVLMPEPAIRVIADPADFNADGVVNTLDAQAFAQAFFSGGLAADLNGDGVIDHGDIVLFVQAFLAAGG